MALGMVTMRSSPDRAAVAWSPTVPILGSPRRFLIDGRRGRQAARGHPAAGGGTPLLPRRLDPMVRFGVGLLAHLGPQRRIGEA